MRARTPRTPLEAISRLRFLVTGWPWRSLGYLLTTPLLVMTVALPLMLLGLPWIALLVQQADGELRWSLGTVVLVVLLGAALVAAGGPLVALPLAIVERWRLRLVDAVPRHRGTTGRRSPACGRGCGSDTPRSPHGVRSVTQACWSPWRPCCTASGS
jgi:hypothetical protein